MTDRCTRRVFRLLFLFCFYNKGFDTVSAKLSCVQFWNGPAATNTFRECRLFNYFLGEYGIELVAPLILSALLFLSGMIIFFGRYFVRCFGSSRRTPGYLWSGGEDSWEGASELEKNIQYSVHGVYLTKAACLLTFLVALIGSLINLYGYVTAARLHEPFRNYTSTIQSQFEQNVTQAIQNFQPSGNYTDPELRSLYQITLQQAVAVAVASIPSFNRLTAAFNVAFVSTSAWGYVFALLPLLWFAGCLYTAWANQRNILPLFLMIALWLTGTLMWFLGFTSSLTNAFTLEFCSEMYAFRLHDIGVFLWLFVPVCNEKQIATTSNLETFSSSVAVHICRALRELCEGSNVSQFPYHPCPSSVLSGACEMGIDQAQLSMLELQVNPMVSAGLCGTSFSNSVCSVRQCAESCVQPGPREVSRRASQALSEGMRSLAEIESATISMRSCDDIMIRISEIILPQCSAVRDAFDFDRAGFYLISIAASAMIVVLLLGQKRFFTLKDLRRASIIEDRISRWWIQRKLRRGQSRKSSPRSSTSPEVTSG